MAAPAERSCVLATWNQIGNNIEARDAGGLWWKATIIDKRDKGVRTEVTVHFVGFSARHDEKVRGAGAPAGPHPACVHPARTQPALSHRSTASPLTCFPCAGVCESASLMPLCAFLLGCLWIASQDLLTSIRACPAAPSRGRAAAVCVGRLPLLLLHLPIQRKGACSVTQRDCNYAMPAPARTRTRAPVPLPAQILF